MKRWAGRSARTGRFKKAASVVRQRNRLKVRVKKLEKEKAGIKRGIKRRQAPKEYTIVQAVSRAIIPGTKPAPGQDYIGRRYVEALERRVYPGKLTKTQREKKRIEARDRLTKEVRDKIGHGQMGKAAFHVVSGIDVTTRTAKTRPKNLGITIDVRDDKQNKRAKYKGRMVRT